MNTLNQDIFSRYPVLSQRLRNVSKYLEEDTLRGVCDLPITNHDIKSIIVPYLKKFVYGQRATFINDDFDFVTAFIFESVPFSNNQKKLIPYIFTSEADTSGPTDELIYSVSCDITTDRNKYHHSPEKYIMDFLKWDHTKSIYFDLITINDFYKQKYQCKFENYAKSKTLEYFYENIESYKNNRNYIGLHLYLIINAIILGISLPQNELYNGFKILESEYHEKIKNIITFDDNFYLQIINRINKIF